MFFTQQCSLFWARKHFLRKKDNIQFPCSSSTAWEFNVVMDRNRTRYVTVSFVEGHPDQWQYIPPVWNNNVVPTARRLLQIPGNYPVFCIHNIKIRDTLQCLQIYLIRYTSKTRLEHDKLNNFWCSNCTLYNSNIRNCLVYHVPNVSGNYPVQCTG